MMKKIFSLTLPLLFFCASINALESTRLLILNMKNEAVLPNKFRTSKDQFITPDPALTRAGLDELNISGSSQFSQKSLETIVDYVKSPTPIYVVDLRQECHGFLNGDAISWYTHRNWGNRGKSIAQISKEEDELISSLKEQKEITVYKITAKEEEEELSPQVIALPTMIENVMSEQQLAEELKIKYVRIPVTDHVKPSEENVKSFFSFVKSLPKDAWVHFHCSAGKGRTTTFMVMFDMVKNAKTLSFDQILARQAAIGGKDLREVEETKETKKWKSPFAKERLDFLHKFYDACKQG